jgi:hypothetical protein
MMSRKVVLVFMGKVCSRLEGLVQMDSERHFESGIDVDRCQTLL